MAKSDEQPKPIQHTPVHQREGVFDPRHPAASPFAVAQPGAGVVSDDAHERGQNLAGGEPAEQAAETWGDQKEVLQENYERDLRNASGLGGVEETTAAPEDKPAARQSAASEKPAAKS